MRWGPSGEHGQVALKKVVEYENRFLERRKFVQGLPELVVPDDDKDGGENHKNEEEMHHINYHL